MKWSRMVLTLVLAFASTARLSRNPTAALRPFFCRTNTDPHQTQTSGHLRVAPYYNFFTKPW